MFEFNCLPFGLSSAPYVFSKILKPLFSFLRSRGFKSVVYLDDFLLFGDFQEECAENVRVTTEMLKNLGFLIYENKSQLIPQKEICYLGFIYNSQEMSMGLPIKKIQKLKDQVEKFLTLDQSSIREFARFIELLVSACPAVAYGWLYTKLFERLKFLALLDNNGNYDALMKLPLSIKEDLVWWRHNIKTVKIQLRIWFFP